MNVAAPLLSVTGLGISRGGVPLLDGIDLALAPGQALALAGPNGIGKTTLLRVIAGLQPPRTGRVEVDADRIAYAGHADGIKAMLTVRENLDFWCDIFGARQGSHAAMAAFDLTALADRPAQRLSAGQKRRLGLARLLVTGRALWLLDEPTVSLDAAATGLFAAALRGHLDAGGAALVATHIGLGDVAVPRLDLGPFRHRPGAATGRGAFDETLP